MLNLPYVVTFQSQPVNPFLLKKEFLLKAFDTV